MRPRHPFAETCEQLLRERLPNLLRLYLSPYVTQTCFCLTRYVQSTWEARAGEHQTFLANGFDEALGGAIKLARYAASVAGRPTAGLVLDPAGRLGPFAGASLAGGGKVEFVPGLVVAGSGERDFDAAGPFGVLVLVGAEGGLDGWAETILRVVRRDAPLIITCVDRDGLAALRSGDAGPLAELAPDVVVFDESFVNRDVPFAAFTARREIYDHWNRPGKTTFHSTTYQPNTVSSLHFMRCLERADPEFHAALAHDLEKIHSDLDVRRELFRRLYSPSLYKAIRATGFDTADVRASGDFVHVNGRRVFDGVSGVACSVRGHNPAAYVEEVEALPDARECEAEVAARLKELTGLDCVLPAVSGATAVENALKVALVAQFPRRHVLALKAGFGGKTLLALTGTASPAYKERIGPLYADVQYVDPFAPDAAAQVETALAKHPVAVVQVELIQAVGGVRPVPEDVLRLLEERRQEHGYLLLADEVQTGMYRTGPFARSRALGLSPDLLVLGKGTSDMMFPFALVLYSAAVGEKLDRTAPGLPEAIRRRYGYEYGYRTVLNVLRRAEELRLAERVAESGALCAGLLREGLASCPAVREVRAFGLLIGVELDAARRPRRWFRKRLFWFYLFSMLRHPRYPVLVGFCQYEPNVLKITPALTAAPADIREACVTITEVLRRPFHRLLAAVLGGLVSSLGLWRRKREHGNVPAPDPVTG
ncbi:MAG TPA: aminotransferase class III-fold pyridoxal phosphate-dependent enzyme [Gemmataceae bacterium]|jgi:acetylornithine/succinyldiaminopimelate/putrescine aminotransferase|nr:aminotransferase class III-fold pyridoxal phosphate-dependent enzyme [Gemmataceae bacterium]